MRDARRARAREIEGPLRQRGGRGVRRLEAWGGGWAREERLSGEPYRVPNACHRTRKRCRVWCTVKRIVAAQSMLHESREKAGQDKEPTSPGEVQDQSVTETSAVTRETGGADLSTAPFLSRSDHKNVAPQWENTPKRLKIAKKRPFLIQNLKNPTDGFLMRRFLNARL